MFSSTGHILSSLNSIENPILSSYQMDAFQAERTLAAQGYPYETLTSPFLYRGDTRPPTGEAGLFKIGMYRCVDDDFYTEPKINADHTTSYCISTSKNLICAVGFADFQARLDNEKVSWVYLIYAPSGIDLTKPTNNNIENAALKVDEVALTGIAPENLLAAIQIRTTKNSLSSYYLPTFSQPTKTNKVTDPISVMDFKVNPLCTLKENNPGLFNAKIAEFQQLYNHQKIVLPLSKTCSDSETHTSCVNLESLRARAPR